ncbi:hypothetical protein OIU84_004959 [Salix udensis]|uniref:MLO-like protein n=1 Tax=Salix udensis TaxID=889485 RepID=A0AAD6K3D9_9ROSI|nr:hypothetical protein OIU84_004959 [Salix udensis]
MAVEEGGAGPTPYRSLQDTPTWALATVCFVFIFTGIFIEYLIHLLSHWLKKSRKTALYEALEKLKSDYCGSRGMTSLISESGINQLNIFIFVIAIMQIVYTVLTMALGRAKMRRWKAWERETQTVEYQAANDPNRFRYTRQTTFARRHMSSFAATSTQLWIAHLPNNSSFNFQRYIQRSLDYDFKEVVGIRPWMWFVVVIFMLVDIHGLHVYLWVSFIPLLNAFELAFFVWVTLQYGIHSCYHESVVIIVVRVVLAVTVQIMCSYITLPLYALVTQMGSQFKGAILDEQTVNAIKQWHSGVRKKMKKKTQDFSLSNHQSYSPLDSNHHHSRNGSQDHIPSLFRNPTLSDITSFHGQIEITEDGAQDFSQHLVPSSVIEIAEVPDLTKK